MPDEVRIWQVDAGDKLAEVSRSRLGREERIEEWIVQDISVLSRDLLIIGQQVETAYGKYIDLLCMNAAGDLVVVELKRDKTPREVTAQALDYASWVKDLNAEDIEGIASKYLKGASLEAAFHAKFNIEFPEVINEHHAMLIVASEIDDSTERIIRYLSEDYGVDINAVRFQFFLSGEGREFLVRTFTVAPEEVEQNTKKSGSKRTFPTAEELVAEATKAGVGELFVKSRDMLAQYLAPKNRKTTCAFGAKLRDGAGPRVVFSLVPAESNVDKGLRYQLYSKRLAECLGVDEPAILSHLPSNPEPYQYYPGAPDDLKGWAGFIKTEEDIRKIGELMARAWERV
jgi:hypothetical protein